MRLFKPLAAVALIALFALSHPAPLAADDQASATQAGGISMSVFTQIMDEVRSNYVEPVTDQQLLEGAVKGMLSSLDPHSGYMDAKDYSEMMISTSGQFGGLGMEVTMENGAVKVISPIDDTPAATAGIKPSDLILAIDGQPVNDMTLQQAVDKLRGAIGTKVTIMVRREGMDPFQVTLIRAEIKVEPVKSHLVGKDVAYLRITSFSELTASALEQAMDGMKKEAGGKLAGVVLDLRNNPGGLLDQAVAVANDFLDSGKIVSIKGRQEREDHTYEAEPGHDLVPGVPMVVLINGGSASASEIVAGALHDDHRAVLLGTRSFGKGSVQTILPIDESAGAIRLTTALYYTPSGRSIQGEGITPDVVVEPARIETIDVGPQQREADLPGALKNEQAVALEHSGAAPAPAPTAIVPAKPAPNIPPGTKPVVNPQATTLESNALGTDQDYQFVRAVDLLRGVTLFQKLAAQ